MNRSDATARLGRLLDSLIDRLFQASPVGATQQGFHKYDGELGDYSPATLDGHLAALRGHRRELEGIDPSDLTPDAAVDRELALRSIRGWERTLAEWRPFQRDPGMYLQLAMFGGYLLITREFAPLEDRMRSLASRLRQVPALLAQARQNVENPPRVWTETAQEMAAGGAGFFNSLIPHVAGSLPDGIKREVLDANAGAVAALEAYRGWLGELLPNSTGDFAAGRRLFDAMLAEDHLLDYNGETLQAQGWRLFEETLGLCREAGAAIDPDRDWIELYADLKKEHPEAGRLLDTYREELARVRRYVVDEAIVGIPPGEELIIEETPLFAQAIIPYAAYVSPAPFEEQQVGRFWVTPVSPGMSPDQQEERLQGHSIHKIPVTTLHEGYPGHHLQLVWSNRAATAVRRMEHCTLFTEGWAFYCEELMEQLGYLDDPRVKLARLKDQLWRAARIILDVGLHCEGMPVEEAVGFLVRRANLEPVNAKAEVRRYTSSPTQPMSYLMGKLEIQKIVADYRRRAGASFRLRDFHEDLLRHGSLPPAMIRRLLFGEGNPR
ncbi:MAG: DUF885 domain-containing protein [bacterium]|nr:DUF885 domain-containing protein [bacterium]